MSVLAQTSLVFLVDYPKENEILNFVFHSTMLRY